MVRAWRWGAGVIRQFLYCWTGYWLLVLLMPVHSIFPSVAEAFFLQFSFVALVCIGYFSVRPNLKEVRMPTVAEGDLFDARVLVRLSIYMSLAGFACLLIDKIFVQHIDYSSGLAFAREQWRLLGEEREGKASSLWSVSGYVLGSAYYVTVVLVFTQPHRFTNGQRARALGFAFVFALLNSVLTGGRSNFLLIAAVAIASLASRSGLRVRDVFASARQRRYIVGIMLATMAYVMYVFYSRAQAGNFPIYTYVVNFLPYMGLEMDRWYAQSVSEGAVGSAANMMVITLGYLTHSFSTAAAIVDAPAERTMILFNNFAGIFYKFGFIDRPETEWFLGGRFPSVPGAVWHQFGLAGALIFPYLLGVVATCASAWARVRPNRLVPLGAGILTSTTLLLTPFVFAPDFLAFPSVVTAFVLIAVLSRVRRHLLVVTRDARGGVAG
jgi:hypothetical protein